MLPDNIEDAAEFALSKVLQTGQNIAKNVMDFLKELDEVCARSLQQHANSRYKICDSAFGTVLTGAPH